MEQSKLLLLDIILRQNRTNKIMENITNKVGNEKDQCHVDHGRKRKTGTAEEPANSDTRKAQLPRMFSKIAGVTLILTPKIFGLHRILRPVPSSRVPGFPVGVVGVGFGCGVCGFVGILFLANV